MYVREREMEAIWKKIREECKIHVSLVACLRCTSAHTRTHTHTHTHTLVLASRCQLYV